MELKIISGNDLIPSKWNPRSEFDEEKIQLLKKSIKGIGLLEPLVVRPGKDGKYFITAGERRWRSNPDGDFACIVRKENELKAKVSCLVENYVREDIADADHEEFISGIYNEGVKQKEWTNELNMETKTGIPQQLISNNVVAHRDRERLGVRNFVNVSTWDILDTRGIADKPKVRKLLLQKRNENKIKGAGRVLQKWSNELNELPEEKGLEVLQSTDNLEDVKIAVEIYNGIREPGTFLDEHISKLSIVKMRCENIIGITPQYINTIKNERDREQVIDLLKGAYGHLHKLLISLNEIQMVDQ